MTKCILKLNRQRQNAIYLLTSNLELGKGIWNTYPRPAHSFSVHLHVKKCIYQRYFNGTWVFAMCRNLSEDTTENDGSTIYCINKKFLLFCDGIGICQKIFCYKTFLMRVFARRTFLHVSVYLIMSGSPTFDIEKKNRNEANLKLRYALRAGGINGQCRNYIVNFILYLNISCAVNFLENM